MDNQSENKTEALSPDCENGLNCMPLSESFQDEVPPITECFKCDVEEYEHEHEIGPHKHHSLSSRNESADEKDDVGGDEDDRG